MRPTVRLLASTQLEVDFSLELGSMDPLKLVEYAGRWDYGPKSVAKMDPDDLSIIGRWMSQGEESMIEMVDATFLITCSRVVSHELVRHRLASYQQESQRFVAYEDETPDSLFIEPDIDGADANIAYWQAMGRALDSYKRLRALKVPKQLARYVLPNSTRTRIIAKMNLREWRHVLRLRMHSSAQPEMRLVMGMIREVLYQRYPILFEDVTGEERAAR